MPDTTTHTTEAPGEQGGTFPPFDSTTFPSQLVWLTLTFVILYVVMARVALPRVGSILESRRGRISADLAEAQRSKDGSDAAIAAYEKALAQARARAQTIAAETRERHAAKSEEERKALEAKLTARLAEAERTIGATKSAAMANVGTIATETAAAIVERLIGTTPSSQDVAAAVKDVLKR
jgi:F-type H+-transporting ATPase subunit b